MAERGNGHAGDGVRPPVIERAWREYQDTVIPVEAGAVQRREMRRAFYAGATSMFEVQVWIGGAGVPEEVGVAVLDAIYAEIRHYVRELKEGRG